jgi:Rrf2 family protein
MFQAAPTVRVRGGLSQFVQKKYCFEVDYGPFVNGESLFMLTKTSLNAIQALIYVARQEGKVPVSPVAIAQQLGASPSYLGKINTQLVKAHLLEAHRGIKGGVTLVRPPASVTLLDIVEACQGKTLGDYCAPHDDLTEVCAFHEAMHGLKQAIIAALKKWTLQDLLDRPMPAKKLQGKVACRMMCALSEK